MRHLKRVKMSENITNWLWCNESMCCYISRRKKDMKSLGVIKIHRKQQGPYQQYQHIADVKDADVANTFKSRMMIPLLHEEFHLPLVVQQLARKKNYLIS